MTNMTITGRLTADPELRFTPSGHAVVNFTVAANTRALNKDTQEWDDEDPVFHRCAAWRELAERVANVLHRGDAVVLSGVQRGRIWEDKEGVKRYDAEIDVKNIGPDLRWMEVGQVSKPVRDEQQGGQQQQPASRTQQQSRPAQQPRQQAPRPQAQQTRASWDDAPAYDEPPF